MKGVFTEINIAEEQMYLLPQKAIYRPLKKQLILSDIHLGKTTHFRKQGMPLPVQAQLRDLDLLGVLLRDWRPLSVLILGDLFHSSYNKEWLWFKSFLIEFTMVQFILIQGNHDILEAQQYALLNLEVYTRMDEKNLVFSHQPLSDSPVFNVCGHVHPGIRVTGKANQSVTLPCFYLDQTHLVLPAFGYLTGLHLLKYKQEASYYLISSDRVLKL